MAWAKNGTPHTLTGTSIVLEVTDLTETKFNTFLTHTISSASAVVPQLRIDGSASTNYAQRHSNNGGADGTIVSQTKVQHTYTAGASWTLFNICYGVNITGEEKLFILFNIASGAAGAGTAPSRNELVFKSIQSAQFTQFNQFDDGGGAFYASDSNVSAHGTD